MNKASKIIKTLLLIALGVFVLVFIAYQLYHALYSPYQTQSVTLQARENKLSVDGMFLRNEEPLSAAHDGLIVHYLYSDGQKVGAGGTVAQLYASDDDIRYYEKIRELDHRISLLKESQDQSSVLVTNADQITTQIGSKIRELSTAIYTLNAEQLKSCKDDLQVLFNRRNIITEKEKNYQQTIAEIEKQKKEFEKKIKTALKNVTAAKNGIMVLSADGFEATARYDRLAEMSPNDVDAFIREGAPEAVPGNTVGKLVLDFDWYYAMVLPIDERRYAEKIKVGTVLKMRFRDISEDPCTVTVQSVSTDETSGKMSVIVTASHMTGKFCSLRRGKAEIIFSSTYGYKVPKSAVRIVDGQKGVYVLLGQSMSFRKIEVLYEEENDIICTSAAGSGSLRPYDDVIVKGTDLYDGKTV